MVKASTVRKWGLTCIAIETTSKDPHEIEKIWCSLCKAYYLAGNNRLGQHNGVVGTGLSKYIDGTSAMSGNLEDCLRQLFVTYYGITEQL